MSRARRNPIGLPAPPGVTLVRAGTGEHTHVLDPCWAHHLCRSGIKHGKVPKLYKTNAKFVTCYRCIKLTEAWGWPQAAQANPLSVWKGVEFDRKTGKPWKWTLTTPLFVFYIFDNGPRSPFSGRYSIIKADGRANKRLGYRDTLDEAKELAEEQLHPLELLALEGREILAKRNPLQPVRTFSPSYDAASQEEYDELAESGPKRWDHTQVKGGRRSIRYGEASPGVSEPTKRRLEERSPPWEARTQSPKVWTQTLHRMGYYVPEEMLALARKNPYVKGTHGFSRRGWREWREPASNEEMWLLDLGPGRLFYTVFFGVRWRFGKALWEEDERGQKWPMRTSRFVEEADTAEEAMERVEEIYLHDLERLALESKEILGKSNPAYSKLYGKRTTKLEKDIRAALRTYHSTQEGRELGLYVPPFVGPLLEAGMPKAAAYELVRRAGGSFLSSVPLEQFVERPSAVHFGPLFTARFGQMPTLIQGRDALVELRGKGHITGVSVFINKGREQVLIASAARIDRLFDGWVNQLKDLGQWQRGMGSEFVGQFFFPWIDRQVRDLAGGEPRSVEFLVRFSGAKKAVRLDKSALQHSDVPAGADTGAQVRYRNLKNVPLSELPGILARIVSRTKREGRRLQPLSSSASLENPMSYWTKQYSKGPYGSSRSLPAARRNRGRPRKDGFKLPPAPNNEYVRMSGKELEKLAKRGSKGAKAELKRRGRDRKSVEAQRKSKRPARKTAAKSTARKSTARKTSRKKSTRKASGGLSEWNSLVKAAAKLGVYKVGMTRAQVERAIAKAKGKSTKRKTASRAKSRKVSAKKTSRKATRKKAKKSEGRKVNTSREAWLRFQARCKRLGCTAKQTSSLWAKYKTGKHTQKELFASVKPKSKGRKAAANPKRKATRKRRNPDATHTREALVPAGYDFWDETHTREALLNHHRGMRGRSAHASDPWHPVYEQVIGQFSTGEDFTHGLQPVNRRNPKKRKARKNGKRKANPQAKRAMKLYHSGEYDSLADAWDAVRNGR